MSQAVSGGGRGEEWDCLSKVSTLASTEYKETLASNLFKVTLGSTVNKVTLGCTVYNQQWILVCLKLNWIFKFLKQCIKLELYCTYNRTGQ